MPNVTIFIPVYNTEKYLGEAIESIIEQTYTDWDLVILDDCSTDRTNEIAQGFADKDDRIALYRNEKNLGMMKNLNHGLPLCKNEYFGKLDADDTWEPDALEMAVEILDAHNDVGLVCSGYENITEEGKPFQVQPPEPPEFARNKSFTGEELVHHGPDKMLKYNLLKQGILLMRRALFDDLGYFKEHDNGDTEMWFRIGCNNNLYCINKILHHHRFWEESFMRTHADSDEDNRLSNLYEARKMIYKYYFEQGKLEADLFSTFMKRNRFLYNSYLIYKARTTGAWGRMLVFLWQNMRINTRLAFKENLHIG